MRRRGRGDGDAAAGHVEAALAGVGLIPTEAQRRAIRVLAGDADVYLWGPPGRGKTVIVDAFVRASGPGTLRRHLHEFFVDLHEAIGAEGGWPAGLDRVLRDDRTGRACETMCFDEFTVHDPANGVFLDRLLRELATRRIRMVATSNRTPAELMPSPLFHVGFEPTIALIEERFTIVEMGGGADLRAASEGDAAATGFAAGRWVTTVGDLDVGGPGREEVVLTPSSHAIPASVDADGGLWMSFVDLCDAPTNAADYLWLARHHRRWTIVGVAPGETSAPLARWAAVLDVALDRDVEIEVRSPIDRETFAAALGSALPDAARTISRMGAWREILGRSRRHDDEGERDPAGD